MRREQAVADRLRRQHEMRRIAVHAVDGDIQVALLGLGGNAGRWPAAHDVHDHDRDFRGGGEPERFDHQRKSGAGGRRQRRRAAIGRADDHVDGGEFVFGLQQRAADFGQVRRQPFENFGRRRDRIGGGKADAAADGAERGRFVARQQPALGGARFRRGELHAEIDAGGGAEAGLDAGAGSPRWRPRPLSARRFSIGAKTCSTVKPSSRAAMPSAIMLGRPSGMALAISFIGISTTRAPDCGHHRRQVAAARIADHQSLMVRP